MLPKPPRRLYRSRLPSPQAACHLKVDSSSGWVTQVGAETDQLRRGEPGIMLTVAVVQTLPVAFPAPRLYIRIWFWYEAKHKYTKAGKYGWKYNVSQAATYPSTRLSAVATPPTPEQGNTLLYIFKSSTLKHELLSSHFCFSVTYIMSLIQLHKAYSSPSIDQSINLPTHWQHTLSSRFLWGSYVY